MHVAEVDTQFYASEIRRLAIRHQARGSLSEAKVRVDDTIKSMQATLDYDCDLQIKKWSELFDNLGEYSNNHAAPEWKTVILYARGRVNCKRHSAKFRRKRFYNKPT